MKVLLLDVMSTLVRDPFRDMPAFFGMTFDELLEHIHPTAWVEFEHGRIDEAVFLERFFADGRAFDHGAFLSTVRSGYAWLPGIEVLLSDLHRAGVPMHALSNYPNWYRYIDEALDLSRFLTWSFVSCQTGLRKPDPEVYRRAARELGVGPSDCIFVDDRGSNLAPARELGMDTIRFEDAAQLRAELSRRGLFG